jgi:c-di-GMP-binding flagellar brake protein YcgR
LAIYFWRKDDAGYVFDTYVLDETFSHGTPVLQVAHSDSLFRTQKRRSIRKRTHKAAYLYLPPAEELPGKIEIQPGLRCIIEDLSDTGCSVTIGGRAQEGLRVKLQFEIDKQPIVMNGIVKSVEFNEEKNRSILHIESIPLPLVTRNRILAEVFDVRPEYATTENVSSFLSPNKSTLPKTAVVHDGGINELQD